MLQQAINKLAKSGGGILKFSNKKYLVNNVIIPSCIQVVGDKTIIKSKDVFYTTTKVSSKKGSSIIEVHNAGGINVGDVLTIKYEVTDIVVVKSKKGNVLTIEPFRITYENAATYKGLKYDQPNGAIVGVRSQIFWITSGLKLSADRQDRKVFIGGVNDVIFDGITFVGSKLSNRFSYYNVFDLITSGALFFYRTSNAVVRNCQFYDFYSTPTIVYGWNEGFKYTGNKVENVGYVLPASVPIQEKDATSGIALHWDQRFDNKDTELSKHISTKYILEGNSFLKCWNGGIFVSATNLGIIRNNVINGFVSKGLSVYGGDLGISTSNISVESNFVMNGEKGNDGENLGTGIWISISNGIKVVNNSINDCETGIVQQGAEKTQISSNSISNCRNKILNK
ncbi:MAG: right-handed parallel beta-helix repeat-containing protein [Flavobacterium sp.]|nr:MAG: right-handed parallel beta-helix repeat-containing protein [Flavobacterium sp.]